MITLAFVCCLALTATLAQVAKRRAADKGPRALGLIQLASNGKAHLVPITIMINGQFYDAGVYKADPVPMALQSEIVYEGEKTGVPQGLFTVSGALPGKDGWTGAGKWQSEADIERQKQKTKADSAKRAEKAPADQDVGGPPKLKRAPGSDSNSTPAQTPPQPSGSSSPSSSGSPSSNPPSTASTTASTDPSSGTSQPKLKRRAEDQKSAAAPAEVDDPNRPMLRHQAPSDTMHEQTKPGNENEPLSGPLELIPAISDADGPEPRPYAYELKSEEQQALLKKMLAMAADQVRDRAAHLSQESTNANAAAPARKSAPKKAKTEPAPEFRNTNLRIFDLSNTNEPVLVLTAEAKMPANDLDFMIALVARQDIYGDLHKAFVQTTDDKHLDVVPRYDLIDAVDADGDGVGELLFRETWDSGTAFAVYRVIGDQLWPLFEGKPGR